MADFDKAYLPMQKSEGGWCHDALDAGGETYRGVARNFFPNWDGWGIIDGVKTNGVPKFSKLHPEAQKILDNRVAQFYREQFWNRFLGDAIPDALQAVANELLDIGVNMGVHSAVTFLQRALNVLNRGGSDYDDLVEDGSMGRKTLTALKLFSARGQAEIAVLVKVLNLLQGQRYLELMRQSESQERFARGWLSRVSL